MNVVTWKQLALQVGNDFGFFSPESWFLFTQLVCNSVQAEVIGYLLWVSVLFFETNKIDLNPIQQNNSIFSLFFVSFGNYVQNQPEFFFVKLNPMKMGILKKIDLAEILLIVFKLFTCRTSS